MERTTIKGILSQDDPSGEVLVQGWVKTRRSSKSVTFVQVNDGTTLRDLQVVVAEDGPDYATANSLTTGCSVSVVGDVVESQGRGQRYEIQAREVRLLGGADPRPIPCRRSGIPRSSCAKSRTCGHAPTPSGPWPGVRNAVAYAIHSFFQERGFQYIQTPIITASDAEGAGSMFRVTTLDLDNPPRREGAVDTGEDFSESPPS